MTCTSAVIHDKSRFHDYPNSSISYFLEKNRGYKAKMCRLCSVFENIEVVSRGIYEKDTQVSSHKPG